MRPNLAKTFTHFGGKPWNRRIVQPLGEQGLVEPPKTLYRFGLTPDISFVLNLDLELGRLVGSQAYLRGHDLK